MDAIICMLNWNNKRKYKCKVNNLDNHNKIFMNTINDIGMCYAENINLPSHISTKINQKYQQTNSFKYSSIPINKYNIIFKCGYATSNQSKGIIFNEKEFYKKEQQTLQAFECDLPKIPSAPHTNNLIYSHRNDTLYSIGGYSKTLKKYVDTVDCLYFSNNTNQNNWKWNTLSSKLLCEKSGVSATFIDNQSKLVIIGGYSSKQDFVTQVEMYDIDKSNSWIQLNSFKNRRYAAGVCYDKIKQRIFLGGGYYRTAMNSVEWFDINKNKWNTTNIPDTKYKHDWCPILWNDEHVDILYIASVQSNCVERIDLRVNGNKRSWKVVYDEKRLSTLLGCNLRYSSGSYCRMIKSYN